MEKYFTWERPPEAVLIDLWKRLNETCRRETFFYSDGVKTADEFIKFIYSEKNYPVFIVDAVNKEIVMMAILNGAANGVATGHFCPIGPYKKGVGKAVIDYWRSLPSLRVVWGSTPEHYDRVLKLVRMLGFTSIGTIPGICYIAKEDKWVGGTISYLVLRENDNG